MKTKFMIAISMAVFAAQAHADSPPPSYYPDRDTVIVDGKPVTLHDLGLTQKTLNHIEPTRAVADYLKTFSDDLDQFGGGRNFYNLNMDLIHPVPGQYVIVSHLPDHCIFTPPDNLPPGVQTANVGCTQDKVTYLVPDYIRKMSDLQKALLYIHERLHAFSALESFEVKTDIIKAANIFLTRYHPAITNPQPGFAYTADELAILNRLTTRLSQISNSSGTASQPIWPVQFLVSGGYIQAPQITSDATDMTITPGSSIFVDSPLQLHGTGLHLSANSVIASQYASCCTPAINGASGAAYNLTLNNVTITNSKFTVPYAYTLVLNRATITDSTVFSPDGQNISDLVVNKSDLEDYSNEAYEGTEDCKAPISDIRLENVKSFQGTICASHVDLENDESLSGMSLMGSMITITGSSVNQGQFAGNRIMVKDTSISSAQYMGDDLHVESSNVMRTKVTGINHFTQIATTLDTVNIQSPEASAQNVSLDHSELSGREWDDNVSFSVSFYSSTALQHAVFAQMNSYQETKVQVSVGTAGQSINLDGKGLTYILNSITIRNQADLDQALNSPKPGKKP